MNERDSKRLLDIRNEAQRAQKFMAGRTRDDLEQDEMLAYAVVRCLEIIGEAAAQTTPETYTAFPQLEWRKMIGMRNRIVHDYGNVDLDIVWYTVVDILPQLVTTLEEILAPK